MLKPIKDRLKNKKGVGTIVTIVLLVTVVPLMIFTLVDVPYYMQYHRRMKNVVDNAAASAVTRIDEKMLAKGTLKMDYNVSRTIMFENLQKWFSLEPVLYDSNIRDVKIMKRIDPETSLLDRDPLVIELKKGETISITNDVLKSTRIEFFIHADNTTYTYRFTNGEKATVSTPTVGIYVESTTHGIFFRVPMKSMKFGVSEVSLDPYNLVGRN